jgi:hypothetical protein
MAQPYRPPRQDDVRPDMDMSKVYTWHYETCRWELNSAGQGSSVLQRAPPQSEEVKVKDEKDEEVESSYECKICFLSCRREDAVHCGRCTFTPMHTSCVNGTVYADSCPQCKGPTSSGMCSKAEPTNVIVINNEGFDSKLPLAQQLLACSETAKRHKPRNDSDEDDEDNRQNRVAIRREAAGRKVGNLRKNKSASSASNQERSPGGQFKASD